MDSKKRGRGRPPLDPADRRDRLIYIRVTEAEEAAIQRAAEAAEESVSDWGRSALLRAVKRTR